MSNPIRCTSTNTAIGEYYNIFQSIKDEDNIINYLKEMGIILYPDITTIITTREFKYADLLYKEPEKDN